MTEKEHRLDEKLDKVLELTNETYTAVQKIDVKLSNTEEKLNEHITSNKEEHKVFNTRLTTLEQRKGMWLDKTVTFVLGAAIAYIITELLISIK